MNPPHKTPENAGRSLSADEKALVRLIADGNTNKEIAAALGMNIRKAQARRAALMRKCEFNSVADLVRYAARHHIIEP